VIDCMSLGSRFSGRVYLQSACVQVQGLVAGFSDRLHECRFKV
jgi:hypothetical protein